MYHTIDEFLNDLDTESGKTAQVFTAVTDASLDVRVHSEGRTLRTLAWHIVTSISEMMQRVGLALEGPAEDAPEPRSADEIREGYRILSSSLAAQIRERWTDETLREERNMYGQMWSNDQTLQVLIRHEIHHRGQLTVLLRQAGVKVPGIYGPSREEWSSMGMEPMP